MTRSALASPVVVELRSEDVEALLEHCEAILDEAVGPHRWIWWRIRQSCIAALTDQRGNHVVDRHVR